MQRRHISRMWEMEILVSWHTNPTYHDKNLFKTCNAGKKLQKFLKFCIGLFLLSLDSISLRGTHRVEVVIEN